jgi:hypothetical protein
MVRLRRTQQAEAAEHRHDSVKNKQVVRARGILVLLLLIIAGCRGGNGPAVDIVVPKGFTGSVWIMLDSGAQEIPLVNGRYEVVIPGDGVLRVRSFLPFEQWHESSARYDDGSALPEADEVNPGGADIVALRGGDIAVTQRAGKDVRWMNYFVGTQKDYSKRSLIGMPPGIGE